MNSSFCSRTNPQANFLRRDHARRSTENHDLENEKSVAYGQVPGNEAKWHADREHGSDLTGVTGIAPGSAERVKSEKKTAFLP
jgi:hypothetical protein